MDVDKTLELALKFHNSGDEAKAKELYDDILSQFANHPDANHLSGVISLAVGDEVDAMQKIQKAIEVAPDQAIFYNSLGNVYKSQDMNEKAQLAFSKALSLDPSLYEAHYNLAKLFEKNEKLENAKYHLDAAIKIIPNSYEGNFSLARILLKLGSFSEAVELFEQMLKIQPDHPDVLNGLAFALEKAGRLVDSIPNYEKSVGLKSDESNTLSNLGHALHACGRADESLRYFRKSLKLDPTNELTWDRYLFALLFSKDISRKTLFEENKRWASTIEKKVPFFSGFDDLSLYPNKKIKLGYYSENFSAHVTSLFFETLLQNHNREFFEVYCYSDSKEVNNVTARFEKKADTWTDVSQMGPAEISQHMRTDGIDIFVGTANFLASNRIISAYQPAPLIVSYMNQVSTTGLSNVDYLITDNIISPSDIADDFFTEKLIRLTNFICYFPPLEQVGLKSPPVTENGYITFGSFNNLAKINNSVVSTWSEILLSVSKSRIKLVAGGFKDRTLRVRYLELFSKCGITRDRVEFSPATLGREEYLDQYNSIDIALDTFPFCGGTVTDEAIYMGVPLITLAGGTEMGLMGKSKLLGLNKGELIATTKDDYINIATQLAQNIKEIGNFKTDIRKLALRTIFDGKNHVLELEQAYRRIWKNYCSQRS